MTRIERKHLYEEAATTIQKNVRKFLDRIAVLTVLYRRAVYALLRIQAFTRGWLVRRKLGPEFVDLRLKPYSTPKVDPSYDPKLWPKVWERIQKGSLNHDDKIIFWRTIIDIRYRHPDKTNTEAYSALLRCQGNVFKAISLLKDEEVLQVFRKDIHSGTIMIPPYLSLAPQKIKASKIPPAKRASNNTFVMDSPTSPGVKITKDLPEDYYDVVHQHFYEGPKMNGAKHLNERLSTKARPGSAPPPTRRSPARAEVLIQRLRRPSSNNRPNPSEHTGLPKPRPPSRQQLNRFMETNIPILDDRKESEKGKNILLQVERRELKKNVAKKMSRPSTAPSPSQRRAGAS